MKTRAIFPIASSSLLVLAGIVCIVVPLATSSFLGTVFIARMLLFCGFVHALSLFSTSGWQFVRRIPPVVVPILIGILMLSNDSVRTQGLTVMLMIFFVLDGFFKVVASIEREMTINIVGLVSAGLSFLLAVYLAAHFPDVPLRLLSLFLGVDLISMGVALPAARERNRSRA
ncbi:DUF308 domain-containing protein [Paraburkholderia rhizosphaerae]|uniref:Uncharacterized membrane protein HdeD (DUF308 family) n=1 Tax=Paraburkholderia rhizosphaerae TaxID=480658 RepID=A0A4R8L482_9BURK|nr:DUF308 domain-containing protein [Paraburkholderia rhizosphaerae]TDY37402.1 uncharacterized membrane protein HdeD (DUF308 family) [Paraburkholderia rhizosphaerae]